MIKILSLYFILSSNLTVKQLCKLRNATSMPKLFTLICAIQY